MRRRRNEARRRAIECAGGSCPQALAPLALRPALRTASQAGRPGGGSKAQIGHLKSKPRFEPRAAFALSGTCFAILLASALFTAACYERASQLDPNPNATTFNSAREEKQECEQTDENGFPHVDWEHWRQVNPDVVGWITVPGTPLDYPVVQAPPDDPLYYLTHDVYRTWNFAGCPYLDAGCLEGGLAHSRSAVVFGHNLGHGDTSLFATVAHMTDGGFAHKHRRVLVQTPETKCVYLIVGSSCIPGSQATKRTSFTTAEDFHSWLSNRLADCTLLLDDDAVDTDQVLVLCTCSYSRWNDERTVVYAVPSSAE